MASHLSLPSFFKYLTADPKTNHPTVNLVQPHQPLQLRYQNAPPPADPPSTTNATNTLVPSPCLQDSSAAAREGGRRLPRDESDVKGMEAYASVAW